MTRLGADLTSMDVLETSLRRFEHQLRFMTDDIDRVLQSVSWEGLDATEARQLWNSRHRRTVGQSAGLLVAMANDIRGQRDAQERTSSDALAPTGFELLRNQVTSVLQDGWDLAAEVTQPLRNDISNWWDDYQERRRLNAWADEQWETTHDLARQSAADQRDWWNSLSEEEQAAMLRTHPELVAQLDGLPTSVIDEATELARLEALAATVMSSTEFVAGFEANGVIVHVGAEITGTMETFGDGSVDLSLELDTELGATLASFLSLSGVAVGTVKYHFDSQEEADEFLDGLLDAATPDADWDTVWDFALGPVGIGESIGDDIGGYLAEFDDNLASVEVGVGIEVAGDISVGGVGIEADARFIASHDSQTDTYALTATYSGELDGVVMGGDAKIEVRAELSNDGTLTSLSLDIEASAETDLIGILGPNLPVSLTPGMSMNGRVEFDLTNPVVAAQLGALTQSIMNGDFSGLTGPNSPLDLATVSGSISTTQSAGINVDFDAKVVEVSVAGTERTVVTAVRKEPGGDFITL
jgi:hypothetical protein